MFKKSIYHNEENFVLVTNEETNIFVGNFYQKGKCLIFSVYCNVPSVNIKNTFNLRDIFKKIILYLSKLSVNVKTNNS